MPDVGGHELLAAWRKAMESLSSSAASVAGHAPVPQQLIEPMQRQLELVEEILDRERRLQRDLAARVVAPVDAVFDLLEEGAETLQAQAQAVQAAGEALAETAVLMRRQADLFERAVVGFREPTELAKAAAGLSPKQRATGPPAR